MSPLRDLYTLPEVCPQSVRARDGGAVPCVARTCARHSDTKSAWAAAVKQGRRDKELSQNRKDVGFLGVSKFGGPLLRSLHWAAANEAWPLAAAKSASLLEERGALKAEASCSDGPIEEMHVADCALGAAQLVSRTRNRRPIEARRCHRHSVSAIA